jgi:hypothetical protein
MVFPLFVLAAIGVVVWMVMSPGQAFLPAFARLLESPVIERNPLSFFSGRSYVTGRLRGREVAVRLQVKRRKYQTGYLVIAVRTSGPPTLDANGIEAHTRDEAGRQALFTIAAHDLLLAVEDGWLKTMWKPVGFTIIFPGRFEEARWRPVLEAMTTVAASLDAPV